jgi:hypothetical protein
MMAYEEVECHLEAWLGPKAATQRRISGALRLVSDAFQESSNLSGELSDPDTTFSDIIFVISFDFG